MNPATCDEYSESGSDTEDDVEGSYPSDSCDENVGGSEALRLRIKNSLVAATDGDSYLD